MVMITKAVMFFLLVCGLMWHRLTRPRFALLILTLFILVNDAPANYPLFKNLLVGNALSQNADADIFLAGTGARLQTLDKITARIDELELSLNQPVRFGTLEITLFHCAFKPPEEPPEHAAFLQIRDLGYSDTQPETAFSGWMFASSPAVSGLEHAVYDVSVTACISE